MEVRWERPFAVSNSGSPSSETRHVCRHTLASLLVICRMPLGPITKSTVMFHPCWKREGRKIDMEKRHFSNADRDWVVQICCFCIYIAQTHFCPTGFGSLRKEGAERGSFLQTQRNTRHLYLYVRKRWFRFASLPLMFLSFALPTSLACQCRTANILACGNFSCKLVKQRIWYNHVCWFYDTFLCWEDLESFYHALWICKTFYIVFRGICMDCCKPPWANIMS